MWQSVWLLSLVAKVTGDFTFTCTQPPSKTGPEIPDLPNQYEMRVEANIIQKQMTIEVLESYDYPGHRVAVTMVREGQTMKSIHNFDSQERYDIFPNDTCVTSRINSATENFNIFGFTVKGKDGKISIASVSDVFKIGKKYNISYVGEEEIRGIPVYKWTSCQVSEELHASFQLDYYFSRPPYAGLDGSAQIPIRFTITGQAKNLIKTGYHNFSHVYEFSIFKPGPIRDTTVFETPRGVVCVGRKNTVPLPKIPDRFSLDIEMDSVNTNQPQNEKIYFDYRNQVVRMDRFYSKQEKHKYGAGLISVIADFNTGLEYVIDRAEDNCTVRPISGGLVFRRSSPSPQNVTMKHAQELLRFKNRTFVYQGERRWRGLTVQAWANISSDNMAQEYYFLKQPPVTTGPTPASVLVGVYIKNITAFSLLKGQGQGGTAQGQPPPNPPNGQGQGGPSQGQGHSQHGQPHRPPPERFVNIYNFHEGHADLEVFDISPCYKLKGTGHESLSLRLTIAGNYTEDVYGHKSLFIPALRNILAKSSKVSQMRISNLQVRQDVDNEKKMAVTFELLDKTPMTGDVAKPPKQISLRDANNNLKMSANYGIAFGVHYPKHSKIFTVEVYSIKEVSAQVTKTVTGATYGSGAMAGLGIGMLLFGGIIGLLIAFIIHRRINTDVPYERN